MRPTDAAGKAAFECYGEFIGIWRDDKDAESDNIDTLAHALDAFAEKRVAEWQRTTVAVLRDDADGSPQMLRLGIARACEIILMRGVK